MDARETRATRKVVNEVMGCFLRGILDLFRLLIRVIWALIFVLGFAWMTLEGGNPAWLIFGVVLAIFVLCSGRRRVGSGESYGGDGYDGGWFDGGDGDGGGSDGGGGDGGGGD